MSIPDPSPKSDPTQVPQSTAVPQSAVVPHSAVVAHSAVPQSNESAKPPTSSHRRRLGVRRETAKAETREALITSAMAAFAAEGFDNPSLDAICAQAGYTRGAFYVHFQDRDELINAVGQRLLGGLLESTNRFDESPAAMNNLVERLVSHTSEDRGLPLHQFLHAAGRSEALRQKYAETLDQAADHIRDTAQLAQARAGMRGDVDASHLTWLLLALTTGLQALNEVGAPVESARIGELLTYLLRRQ